MSRPTEPSIRRIALIAVIVLHTATCACFPVRDSCACTREFKAFTMPSRLWYSLPRRNVRELPPEVRYAVDAFVVYSVKKKCIVGTFTPYGQG